MLTALSSPKKIIIVEDKVSFALQLASYLAGKGHEVFVYEGVESIEDGTLWGIRPLTSVTPDSLELKGIEVAFLDHYFSGVTFNGTSLTRELAPLGIRIIGMSSVDHANQSMMRSGAVVAMLKDRILPWLRSE